jgi:hypothetical protein
MNDGKPGRPNPNRRVIDCTCTVHGGARGFVPLVATKRDGDIELSPCLDTARATSETSRAT